MATITAATAAPSVVRATLVNKGVARISSAPILGLPQMKRDGKVRCSMEKAPQAISSKAAAMLTAVSTMAVSSPALALVDERLSTEGTGLSLGISNNLLAWILLGVFGLIWSFYIVYTSTLEEDEESGLSL